jgi:two-component system, LytTR family, sensor kinase
MGLIHLLLRKSTPNALRLLAICLLAWTVVGLIYFGQDVTRRIYRDDLMPWREAPYMAVRAYMCAALTPFVLWFGRRWPVNRERWLSRLGLHLLLSACFVLTESVLSTAVLSSTGVLSVIPLKNDFASSFPILTIWNTPHNFMAYWVILGIQSGVRYYKKFQAREKDALRLELHASELKGQLVHAQLSALKMQLQPHFLFNTLNAIAVLVVQQKANQAQQTISRFSDLLRAVLSDMDAQEVPLSRELEHLQLYLSIEQLRFSDRLHVVIDVDPAVLDAAVPHMSLQPIVENAVRHGIGSSTAAGLIQILAAPAGEQLLITVKDDGPGFPCSRSKEGSGIGLTNTRARLRQLYGNAAELLIANSPGGGTIVTIRLPYRVDASLCA